MSKSEMADSVLLPMRPLLRTIASLFDFNGSIDHDLIEEIRMRYHRPPPITPAEDAIRSTWQAVGDSMSWAIREYEKELDEKKQV